MVLPTSFEPLPPPRPPLTPPMSTRSNNWSTRRASRPGSRQPAAGSQPKDACIYSKWCGNPGCMRAHPPGWDPHVVKFDRTNTYCVYALNGAECSIPNCTRTHSITCPKGANCCTQCILRHPDGHQPRAVQCKDDCRDVFCLGVHGPDRVDDFCLFDPFCTRTEDCGYPHSELNGRLRMVKGYCNYKANGLICQHRDPCPYNDPTGVKCSNGHECRWRGCGFRH